MNVHRLVTAALLVSASAAVAQTPVRPLELGVRAGGTFTHGFTNIPAQPAGTAGVEVPALENQSNGLGYGYTGGLWARKNFNRFFVQAEATYNRFVLRQLTNVTLDVNANSTLANSLPVSVQPGLLNATLTIASETALETINVPVLLGRRWLNGRLRGYVGPQLFFIRKAEARRNTSGLINTNAAIGFGEREIPATTGTTNLLNRFEARNLEVKDVTYAVELGAGFTPVRFLDVDVRYALPVGGLYNDRAITGFLGFATVSVGFRVL